MEGLDQLQLRIDVVGFVLSDLDYDPLALMGMGKETRWVIWHESSSQV